MKNSHCFSFLFWTAPSELLPEIHRKISTDQETQSTWRTITNYDMLCVNHAVIALAITSKYTDKTPS